MTTNINEMSVDEKYELFKTNDPLPNIKPSLLNSADIRSYVKITGLIDPFYDGDLKSASYAAKIEGKCRYWDDDSKTFSEVILEKPGDKLILKPNAIAFVGIEPTFRLPDYIALRFNLKITHVYRGLLLGTGPLIDPGFVGKISIPLHNLTSNEYVFSFGEQLIWIEFTKTSELPIHSVLSEEDLDSYEDSRCRNYVQFNKKKTDKDLDFYISQALKGTPHKSIISSVPSAVNDAIKYAKNAEESASKAEKSTNTIRNWGIASALAVIISVAALVISSWSLQKAYFAEAVSQVSSLRNDVVSLQEKFEKKHYNTFSELQITYQDLLQMTNEQSGIIKQLTFII
jgi:deoxycytidine triphosphate deaminase